MRLWQKTSASPGESCAHWSVWYRTRDECGWASENRRIVDFARRGADGIINAVCFNCMVGNASAAIIEKIRNDYHDIPIVTAVYSGGEEPSRAMVLEAFVSQVKRHYARMLSPRRGKV